MSQTLCNEGSAEGCPVDTMEASEVEELYAVCTNQCSLIILFEIQCLSQILEAKDHKIQRLTAAFEEASEGHQMLRPKAINPLAEVTETGHLYAFTVNVYFDATCLFQKQLDTNWDPLN